jgi:hypothetical protein
MKYFAEKMSILTQNKAGTQIISISKIANFSQQINQNRRNSAHNIDHW